MANDELRADAAASARPGGRGQPAPMRAAARRYKWRAEDRQAFLDVLATTGNISQAARSIGRTSNAAHRLRTRDAGFAAAWASAVDSACEAIHAAAIAAALRTAGNGAGEPCPTCGAPPEPFDAALAFRILNYRATRDAKPKEPSRGSYRRVPIEEVDAMLNRKIDAIIRARENAAIRAQENAAGKARQA